MKLHNMILATMLLFSTGITSTIHADENTDKSDLEQNVEQMFDDTNNLFSTLKDKYTDLSKNYGKLEIKESDEVYQKYLSGIQDSKSSLKIEEKLEDIKNIDLSVNNNEMKAEFEKAKKDAAEALLKAKLGSDAIKNKFDNIQAQQTAQQAKIEKERMNAAAKRYTSIADKYNETLAKGGGKGVSGVAGNNAYSASDLKYLSHAMGINFSKAIVSGKLGIVTNLGLNFGNEIGKMFGTKNGSDLFSAMNK